MSKQKKTLTRRQKEVVEYIARDYIIKEIASELQLSEQAIHDRLDRAKDRLGVSTLPGLVAAAEKNGCIDVRTLKPKKP
jgi:DNA-binding NarL/FixJ family response regulator